MPRVHSCGDLPDELQAWAKTVANLVTDRLSSATETGGRVGLGGFVVGSCKGTGDE
jgi:hypothetical protein